MKNNNITANDIEVTTMDCVMILCDNGFTDVDRETSRETLADAINAGAIREEDVNKALGK